MKIYKVIIVLIISACLFYATAQEKTPEAEKETKPENSEETYKLPELGESYKTIASEAIAAKDYDKAIEYYTKWVKADPQDESGWYNLACCFAVKDKLEDAVHAFECAVAAGWNDAAWAQEDTDLEKIWKNERFLKAIDQIKIIKSKEEPSSYHREYIEMSSLGTYIVMLPPNYNETKRKYPVVVILHGSGSSELGHGRIADKIGRDDVIYVVPRYSYPNTDVYFTLGREGFSSWPMSFGEDAYIYLDLIGKLNMDWFFTCVEDAKKKYRVNDEKVSILGHSQGSYLALMCAVNHPEKIKSYFGYAGSTYSEWLRNKVLKKLKENGIKVYLAHGSNDNIIPIEYSKEAAEAMKKANVDCTFKIFDSTHAFTEEVFEFARSWLNDVVKTEK